MLTPEQIKVKILEDVRDFTKECLEEETVWQGHLRWIILKRMILGGKNPATMEPIPDYTKEQLKNVIKEMEGKTSRGLEKIHAKYLW